MILEIVSSFQSFKEISFKEIPFEEISFEEMSFTKRFLSKRFLSKRFLMKRFLSKRFLLPISQSENSTRINTSQHKVRTYSSYDMLSFTLCLSRISMQIACCNLIYQDRHLPLYMKTIHIRSFIYPTMQVNDMTMVFSSRF